MLSRSRQDDVGGDDDNINQQGRLGCRRDVLYLLMIIQEERGGAGEQKDAMGWDESDEDNTSWKWTSVHVYIETKSSTHTNTTSRTMSTSFKAYTDFRQFFGISR